MKRVCHFDVHRLAIYGIPGTELDHCLHCGESAVEMKSHKAKVYSLLKNDQKRRVDKEFGIERT